MNTTFIRFGHECFKLRFLKDYAFNYHGHPNNKHLIFTQNHIFGHS